MAFRSCSDPPFKSSPKNHVEICFTLLGFDDNSLTFCTQVSHSSNVRSRLKKMGYKVTCRRGRRTTTTMATTTTESTTTESTTTTESSDDLYMIAVKALIDAGTCETVASNSNCGDDAISYFKDFEYNGERVIVSSGIPDHEAEHDILVSNPNTRCEHWQFMVVPLSQSQASSSSTTGLGVVGFPPPEDISSTTSRTRTAPWP